MDRKSVPLCDMPHLVPFLGSVPSGMALTLSGYGKLFAGNSNGLLKIEVTVLITIPTDEEAKSQNA